MKSLNVLTLFILLTVTGILGNLYNIEMFFGVNQIFGSVFVLIAVWLFGPSLGVLCAVIVHSYTIILWGHPYAFISFVLEALFVSFLLKKKTQNIFIADVLYWIFIGVPIAYVFYGIIMGMNQTQVSIIMLKQPANALFNALIAGLIVYFVPIEKIFLNKEKRKFKFKHLILNLIMGFTIISLFFAANKIASHVFYQNLNNIKKDITHYSNIISTEIELFKKQLEHSMFLFHKIYKSGEKQFKLEKESTFENVYLRHKDDKKFQLIAYKDLTQYHSFPYQLVVDENLNTFQLMPDNPDRFFIFTRKKDYYFIGTIKMNILNKLLDFKSNKNTYKNIIVNDIKNNNDKYTNKEIFKNRSSHLKGKKQLFNDNLYILFPDKQDMPKMLKWKKAYITMEHPSIGKGFRVVTKKSLLPMMNDIQQLYIKIFSFMLLLIGIALIISSWVSSLLESSIYKISQETSNLPEKLLNNQQPVWPESSIKEINTLIENFKTVSHTLHYIFQESESRYNNLFAYTTDALFVVKPQTLEIIDINQQTEILIGSSREDIVNKPINKFFDNFSFENIDSKDSIEDFNSYVISKESKIAVKVRMHAMRNRQNDVYFFIVKNIQKSIQMQDQLQLVAKVFETTHDGILITDNKKQILMVNKAFERITGYMADEVKGNDPKIISSGWHDRSFYQKMWQSIYKEGSWQGEITDRKKTGEIYIQILSIYAVKDEQGKLNNYIGIIKDITEQKEAQDRVQKLSNYDSLTDLPNRSLLKTSLANSIHFAKQNDLKLGLLIIDMDNFKAINDSFGFKSGDILIKSFVSRIQDEIKDIGTLGRIGANSFALIVEKVTQSEDLAYSSQKVLNLFSKSFIVEDNEIYMSASIGICLYPDDAQTAEKMLQFAEIAMHRAKDLGKKRFEFYTQAQNESTRKKIFIESGLRKAIDRNELSLYYQPQVNILSGKIVGCEALLRWIHPEKGFIPPDVFIPVAEDSGLIGDIEEWVIKTSARQIKKLKDLGIDIIMSVNISNYQFRKKDFIDITKKLIEEEQAKFEWFELELTERIIMDHKEVIEKLEKLKSLGFSLALDDFGTGYSSLAYLKKFNIDILKIDKSFIQDLPDDAQSCDIVRAIISLAESLKMSTIAEGAEIQGQLDFLADLNCELYQGYFFSKPLPVDEFEKLLFKEFSI